MNPVALFTSPFSRALLGVAVVSAGGMLLPTSSRTPYFFSAGTFFVTTIALALAALALHRQPESPPGTAGIGDGGSDSSRGGRGDGGVPAAMARAFSAASQPGSAERPLTRTESAGHALALISFATFGYALMELFYAAINLRLGLDSRDSSWSPFFQELDGYVLDRSYQYLALAVFFLLLRYALGATFTSFVSPGDTSRETVVLGKEQPMSWRRACFRLAVMLLGLAALGFLARPAATFAAHRWPAFLGRLLGGTNNSFIEELLFRGLLLPALLVRLEAGPANLLQAVLFAFIHWGYVGDGTWQPAQQEAVKLGLYSGIGLLLGRAAYETRGIGISTLLHALITAAIWSHLTFGAG